MTTSHPSAHRRYKHVVFDPRGSRGRILDFAPRAAVRRSRFTFSPFEITKNLHLLPRRESRLGSLDATEESFVLWLFEQAGINGRAFRAETLRRRMSACLRVLRVENVLQARLLLMRKPELLQLAVGVLSAHRA